ncbi:MAG: hypothetical protein ACJZ9G_11785 [Rhodospirillales bacterium]
MKLNEIPKLKLREKNIFKHDDHDDHKDEHKDGHDDHKGEHKDGHDDHKDEHKDGHMMIIKTSTKMGTMIIKMRMATKMGT